MLDKTSIYIVKFVFSIIMEILMMNTNMDGGKPKATAFIIITVAVLLVIAAAAFVLSNGRSRFSPEKTVRFFYNSLLPNYNESELKSAVGGGVFDTRFDDDGYFADRLSRVAEQIRFYYGNEFKSELSDFSSVEVKSRDFSAVNTEYKSKYSLEADEILEITFKITLSGSGNVNSRYESVKVIRINGTWYVYDYDAYWFPFM